MIIQHLHNVLNVITMLKNEFLVQSLKTVV